jgi:hypothetical protein
MRTFTHFALYSFSCLGLRRVVEKTVRAQLVKMTLEVLTDLHDGVLDTELVVIDIAFRKK